MPKSSLSPPGPAGPTPRGRRLLLPGLLLLLATALGVRITGASLTRILPDGDALGYLEAARHVARGEGLATNWARSLPRKDAAFPRPFQGYPALPLLIGLLGRTGLPLEGTGIALVLAFLVLGLLALFKVWEALWLGEGRKHPPAWAALLPPALLAFHKHLTVATVEVLTDGPALALGTTCLWLLLAAGRKRKARDFLLLSLLAGLAALAAALFRFQDFFLLALGPGWFLMGGQGPRKATGTAAFLLPALGSAWALPQGAARIQTLLSSQQAPSPLQGLLLAFDPSSPHSLFAGLGPLVWFSLGGFLFLLFLRRPRPSSGWFLVLLYLAAGLIPLLFLRPEKGWLHPWFFADRPVLQLLPPLVLLASAPLAALRRLLPRRFLAWALLVLLLFSLRASWRYAWKRKRLTPPPEIQSLLEALKNLPGARKSFFLSPEMRFLAWEGDYLGFQARDPYTLPQVLGSLPGSKVKWVVTVSRWDLDIPWAKELLFLPPSRVPPPLRLLREFPSGGEKARIFRVETP